MTKKKILLTYISESTFVKKDFEYLKQLYSISKYHFKPQKNILKGILQLLKQLFFLIFKGWKYNVFFIWFSDYHSILPIIFAKIFKKKSLLIIGGYDATGIKELNYGILYSNKIRRFCNKYSIKYCDYVLPVDKSLIKSTNKYASKDKTIQVGIKHIVEHPKGIIMELPTGYDYHFWKRNTKIKRNNDVMCVAGISDKRTWVLKGGDLLLNIAKITPEINFHFYGIGDSFRNFLNKKYIPENFHIYGYIDNAELPDIYSKHKVYAQFSLSEGLPNVLCEAMLCECIPVGSEVNGIPNAIGDKNFILNNKDTLKAKNLILNAIESNDIIGQHFRNRIITKFNQEKRQFTLLEILNKL